MDLKQRHKDDTTAAAAAGGGATATSDRNWRAKKLAMAKRGLRSLAVALLAPLALSLTISLLSGGEPPSAGAGGKKLWRPPAWAFHLASASTSCLMGLSAWLVWAEGGFHRRPATGPLYVAQLLLGLVWAPLVFAAGAARVGLLVAVLQFVVLAGCMECFRRVNPIAGDLVKPCMAWVSFLVVFSYKLA